MLLELKAGQARRYMLDDVPRRASAEFRTRPAELTIVVPTFNERANIGELVDRVRSSLAGADWEIIIVDDDSPDGTADYASHLHRDDPRVRVIRRLGRRGLSSACMEGIMSSSARYVAVMDADLQHDPALLKRMLSVLRGGETDLVCASRNCPGGSVGEWDEQRIAASRMAEWAARQLNSVQLSDPMSGYFAMRREVAERLAPRLSGVGFKLLLDMVLAAGNGLKVVELPFTFGLRARGESKLSARVIWDYAMMLIEHRTGGRLSAATVSRGILAGAGLLTNMLALWILFDLYGVGFAKAAVFSAISGCVAVYGASELLSYRTRGPWRWYLGLLPFLASCAIGVLANALFANWVVGQGYQWFVAGCCGAALGFALVQGAIGRHLR